MNWLEQHHVMCNFLHKSILCTDSQGNQVKIQGIPNKVSIRKISTLQENKCIRKGCKLFVVNIQNIEVVREQHIEDFLVLVDFKDVFPKQIPRLPLKREFYFSKEMTPGSGPASKSPYRINASELAELKLQL